MLNDKTDKNLSKKSLKKGQINVMKFRKCSRKPFAWRKTFCKHQNYWSIKINQQPFFVSKTCFATSVKERDRLKGVFVYPRRRYLVLPWWAFTSRCWVEDSNFELLARLFWIRLVWILGILRVTYFQKSMIGGLDR